MKVLPGVLDAEACGWLLALDAPGDELTFTPVPEGLPDVSRLLSEVDLIGSGWGLPRRSWKCTLASYPPGAAFPLHTDYDPTRGPAFDAHSYSASVLLTPPDAYRGGDLLVRGATAPREVGTGVVFDAFTPHEVTPVTSGRRVALVVFAVVGTNADALKSGLESTAPPAD